MVCDYFLQPDDCLIFKECSFSFLCPASWDSEILTLLVMGGVLKTHSSPFAIAHFFAKKCSAKFLLISLSFLNFPYFVTTQFLKKKKKKILSQIGALSTELWPFSQPHPTPPMKLSHLNDPWLIELRMYTEIENSRDTQSAK